MRPTDDTTGWLSRLLTRVCLGSQPPPSVEDAAGMPNVPAPIHHLERAIGGCFMGSYTGFMGDYVVHQTATDGGGHVVHLRNGLSVLPRDGSIRLQLLSGEALVPISIGSTRASPKLTNLVDRSYFHSIVFRRVVSGIRILVLVQTQPTGTTSHEQTRLWYTYHCFSSNTTHRNNITRTNRQT